MKTKVTSMTEAEIRSAAAALVELRNKQMTFVLPLTSVERSAMPRLGRNSVQTTQMRAIAARAHSDALPPSFDLRAFEHETALLTALEDCLAIAEQIRTDLHDTFLVVGTGALQTSKVAFGHIQVVADATGSVTRAVQHLKLRKRKSKPDAAAPAEPGAPASMGASATVPPTRPPTSGPPPDVEGKSDASKAAA